MLAEQTKRSRQGENNVRFYLPKEIRTKEQKTFAEKKSFGVFEGKRNNLDPRVTIEPVTIFLYQICGFLEKPLRLMIPGCSITRTFVVRDQPASLPWREI